VRGAQAMPVPGVLLKPALARARALRLTRLHESDLVHLKYSCLVDGRRAQEELGFAARRSLHQALLDLG
jgi:hypothetical protein